MPGRDGTGPSSKGSGTGKGRGKGGRLGRQGGAGSGPGGNCVCPLCSAVVVHQRGVPCYQIKCPKCGTSMIRK